MTPELSEAIRQGLRRLGAKLKEGWDQFLFSSQFIPLGLVTGPARGFSSFAAFKGAAGPAGVGKHWHHIVGQTAGNVERFGASVIHNTDNLIALDAATHARISGYYSSKQAFTNGQTVREWLGNQSLEAQREFGLQVLRDHGVTK